jgi:hypothetical protein
MRDGELLGFMGSEVEEIDNGRKVRVGSFNRPAPLFTFWKRRRQGTIDSPKQRTTDTYRGGKKTMINCIQLPATGP